MGVRTSMNSARSSVSLLSAVARSTFSELNGLEFSVILSLLLFLLFPCRPLALRRSLGVSRAIFCRIVLERASRKSSKFSSSFSGNIGAREREQSRLDMNK